MMNIFFRFFKLIIIFYFLVFIFINCIILINSEKIIKYIVIKIDNTFENASPETLLKLENIANKFNVKIEYKSIK